MLVVNQGISFTGCTRPSDSCLGKVAQEVGGQRRLESVENRDDRMMCSE